MFLKHIEISQVQCIERVTLDFSRATGGSAEANPGLKAGSRARAKPAMRQRTVLVGENGCGKSAALRAIALVLAGSDALADLLREPARWVRQGQKEGRIQALVIDALGAEREISLTLRPEWNLRQTLAKNAGGLSALDGALVHSPRNYFTLAYGASRRPAYSAPLNSRAIERGQAHARARGMATLFAPEATLMPIEPWAMRVDKGTKAGKSAPAAADAAAGVGVAALRQALKKLLPGVTLEGIDRKRGELRFKTADGTLAFTQLSHAHQTMANWCADVLYRIGACFEGDAAPLKARGVLLVDGLDLHLHPVWQRGLLDAISAALPHLQLVATTNSPMLAQQLRAQELHVLARPGPKKGVLARVVQGDPSQLTLSQMMSPLFGVDTGDSARIAALRGKARARGGALAGHEIEELAQLSPVDSLPLAMREQLKASAELADAVWRASRTKGAPPQLDTEKLRLKMGERIRSAALRARGAA